MAALSELKARQRSNPRTARSSNTILAGPDCGKWFEASSNFTQTLTAAATLGASWWCWYLNVGGGTITFDPNGAETVNGSAAFTLGPGQGGVLQCDGSNFRFLFPGDTSKSVQIAVSDPLGAAITTGDGKGYFSVPPEMNGMNLVAQGASFSDGDMDGVPIIQLRRVRAGAAVDMLSTRITVDDGESDSATAATPAVIDAANDDVATADQVFIDIDGAGSLRKGLNVRMTFRYPA